MGIVLIDPPAPTPTNHEIAYQEIGEPAPAAGAEYLSMPDVMAEQTKLHRDEAHVERKEKQQPEIVNDEQASDAYGKQARGKEKLPGIVGRLLVQPSALLDELLQLDVLI